MNLDHLTETVAEGPQDVAAAKLIEDGARAVAIVYLSADNKLHINYRVSERTLSHEAHVSLLCGADNLAHVLGDLVINASEEMVGNA